MEIVETFIKGKSRIPEDCEDGILLKDDMIVVVDGATAKGNLLWNGQKSGLFAKKCLLEAARVESADQSAEQFFQNLNLYLRRAIEQEHPGVSDCWPSGSVIVYNDFRREIWSYGDCQCRINQNCYLHEKAIDKLNADVRAMDIEYLLQCGTDIDFLKKEDKGREFIQKNLECQRIFENKICAFGYPVLNGRDLEMSMLKIYPVKEGDSVVLSSDGYPVLCETLQKSEEKLKYILKEDPLCFREYRSTKGCYAGKNSFDDRAYCRIIV